MSTSSFSEGVMHDLLERNYSLEGVKHGDGELNSRNDFSLLDLVSAQFHQGLHHPVLVEFEALSFLLLLQFRVSLLGHLGNLTFSSVINSELQHLLGLQAAIVEQLQGLDVGLAILGIAVERDVVDSVQDSVGDH